MIVNKNSNQSQALKLVCFGLLLCFFFITYESRQMTALVSNENVYI